MSKEGLHQKIVIALIAINVIVRIPFLNLPAHWDETIFFLGAQSIYYHSLNPFIEFWGYKPPLFFELTAILFEIFNPSRWIGRLLVAVFSSLGIVFTYKLGKRLFNSQTGLIAAILLFLHPLYFTQSNLFQVSVPLASLFILVLYAYFTERKTMYAITASLFVLTKEVAVLAIISLVIFDILVNRKRYGKAELLRREIFHAIPIALFFLWMFINKIHLGWFLWPRYFSDFSYINNPHSRPTFSEFFSVSFKRQLLWIIYGLSIGGLLFSLSSPSLRKRLFRKEVAYFLSLSILLPLLYFSFYFLPRYTLLIYPGLFLSFGWFITKLWSGKKRGAWFITTSMCLLFLFQQVHAIFIDPKAHMEWGGERNLSYLRVIWLGEKVTNAVAEKDPSTNIITSWPALLFFRLPLLGYVESPVPVRRFEDCSHLNNTEHFLLITSMDITTAMKNREIQCAHKLGLKLLEEIDISDKFPNADSPQLPIRIYLRS